MLRTCSRVMGTCWCLSAAFMFHIYKRDYIEKQVTNLPYSYDRHLDICRIPSKCLKRESKI